MVGGGRGREAPRPVRCEDCRHGFRLARVCSLQPLCGEWPGEKRQCIYYEERGGRDGESGRDR